MRIHTVPLAGLGQLAPGELSAVCTGLPPPGALGHPWDSLAKSVLPASAQAIADLCLGWRRLAQQKHVLKEASNINISNDRAKEEVPKQAGWNGLEGGGHEEDTGQTALACWAPGLQDLTQCLMSLLLQMPDVGGGVETWHARVEEDGSFQVGILFGAQLQAPEGLQAALKPLHRSQ